MYSDTKKRATNVAVKLDIYFAPVNTYNSLAFVRIQTHELKSVHFELGKYFEHKHNYIIYAFVFRRITVTHKSWNNVYIVNVIPFFQRSWSCYCCRFSTSNRVCVYAAPIHSNVVCTSIRTVPLIVYLILCHLWWLLVVCAREWNTQRADCGSACLIFHSSVLFSVCFYSHIFIFDLNEKKTYCRHWWNWQKYRVEKLYMYNCIYALWALPFLLSHTSRILFCFHYNFGEIIWFIEAKKLI